ncbi:MAG: glutaredoxin domain-containing protein [Terrimesophilobacter sp.]
MALSRTVVAGMENTITVYGADWCSDCRRSKKLLDEMGVDYEYVDLIADPTAADRAQAISGHTTIPVIAFSDGTHFVEPSDEDLRDKVEALAGRL